ncbi:MAG: hypothetical protein Q8N17_23780 [Burkholderiaceae bacterium]|nr:hypothetical protein [Burkholderiaceae bacterium]
MPPASVQLKRISLALGLPDTQPATAARSGKPVDAMREAMAAGLPVMEGRPDDPMLDLIGL